MHRPWRTERECVYFQSIDIHMHDIYTVTCNTEILESGSGDTNHINDDQTERLADTEMKYKHLKTI